MRGPVAPQIELLFFDHHPEKVESYRQVIDNLGKDVPFPPPRERIRVSFACADVRNLLQQQAVDVVVSPANSLGFMDGGIDMYYMQLFPGIQQSVQQRIRSFGVTSALGRHMLPVGSAILVSTGNPACPFLASVPTMFLPEDINGTRNVYWATLGLLAVLTSFGMGRNGRLLRVAVPCMGTGVGKLSAQDSAQQIREALQHFYIPINHYACCPLPERIAYRGSDAYVLNGVACPQRHNYANTEIQPGISSPPP